MRQLAIECASEACSVALFEGADLIDHRHLELGRGHAERLVPLIAELPDKGKAQRILVSRGPGSFTGVRIGLAAARALGFAWQADVLGYPTLALVAETARAHQPGKAVSVCMNGGHGEWFMQDFASDGRPQGSLAALPIAQAKLFGQHTFVAGNRANERCEDAAAMQPLNCLPDARNVLAIPADQVTTDLAPIYGRAPDAALPAQ